MSDKKIKLKAADAEDLAIIAALLQDARSSLRELVFQPDEKRFLGAFQRYRREAQVEWTECEGLTECEAVIIFDQVATAQYRGLDPDNLDQPLQLLTIATAPGKNETIEIELVMAGEADIRITAAKIACKLEDFGEPRPAQDPPCDHFADRSVQMTASEADQDGQTTSSTGS